MATKKKPAAKTKSATRKPLKKKKASPAVPRKKPALKRAKPVRKPLPKKPVAKKTARKTPKQAAKGLPEMQRDAALKILDERQASDVMTVDMRGRSAMADYVIAATGRSGRQLAAMADYLREAFVKMGIRKIRIEGAAQGDWVLIDGGDVLVHLFRPEVRRYYNIEDIWIRARTHE
ncbi:MAG: ribosome silencing factor [Alphaproteobacteria bacterium]|nr:ribosome silencing factor [Alphaproteobacteria bacterium]